MKAYFVAIIFVLAVGAIAESCQQSFGNVVQSIAVAAKKPTIDATIDDTSKIMIKIPNTLQKCQMNNAADLWRLNFPEICINDLKRAAKLGAKISNQLDNDIKVAFDLTMLKMLYSNKIKKHCPLFTQELLTQFNAGGVCLESIYQLSLRVQQFIKAMENEDKNKAIHLLSQILQNIPLALSNCGFAELAAKLQQMFPPSCVNAVDSFIIQMSVVLKNYDHWQWVVKHEKQIMQSYKKMKVQCPLWQ